MTVSTCTHCALFTTRVGFFDSLSNQKIEYQHTLVRRINLTSREVPDLRPLWRIERDWKRKEEKKVCALDYEMLVHSHRGIALGGSGRDRLSENDELDVRASLCISIVFKSL